jgi:HAD superfamily hydrolase (TIGR01509 family)
MNRAPGAVIFDFDGVIADSEAISNRQLAEALTAIGLPTSFEDCLSNYYGRNWPDCEQRIVAQLGCRLPGGFVQQLENAVELAFERDLTCVAGAADFIKRHAVQPKAIASSSSREYLASTLDRFGLAEDFGEHLYSAANSKRGKPYPDIYLEAATGLGIPPVRCLVIEDSPVGVSAGVAAGMMVVGLLVGEHIIDEKGHGDQLAAAGAHYLARTFEEIDQWMEVA